MAENAEAYVCRICRVGKGKCLPGMRENHVRQDSRCRLHGLEQRHHPPAQRGERVSRTTENLVKIQCDGVAVGDTATWHRLIEKFVPVETTWLSRPLLLQKGGSGGEDDTFFDVSLGRNYTSAEGLESCAKPGTWTASRPRPKHSSNFTVDGGDTLAS